MKCILIGGAGFIGSWLTKKLIDSGHQVVIIDPLYEYGADSFHLQRVRNFRNKYLLTNATIYNEKFEDRGEYIIKKEKPHVVIHLAGFPLELPFDHPFSLQQISQDTILTYKVLLAVKKYKIKKIIFLSSIAPYGNIDFTVNEKAPVAPVTVYGVSKTCGEFLTSAYLDNWVIVRSTNVYGFADIHRRVINTLVNHAQKKEKAWINENAWLDFIYVKDLVEGIYQAMKLAPMKEIFHISGGRAHKLSDFIKYLYPYYTLKYDVKNLRDKPDRGTMDNSKARMLLGWYPKMDLKKGIADYMKYVKKYKFA